MLSKTLSKILLIIAYQCGEILLYLNGIYLIKEHLEELVYLIMKIKIGHD